MPEEIDLRALLKLIIRKKKIILGGTLICVILAGGLSFIISKTYESSLILKVGRIYLSSPAWKPEMQFIEEPDATATVMGSKGILAEVRSRLKLNITLQEMKNQLEILTFVEASEYLPIIEVTYEAGSPRAAVEVLNALAAIIIDRHQKRYVPYQTGLEKRIEYNQEKISAIEKINSAQTKYRDLTQNYIASGEVSVEEFLKELGDLEASSPSAVDMLYLQGSALTEKQNITDLTRFKSEMDILIAKGEQAAADAGMEIADLQSRLGLSSPTMIVSPAVLVDKPVKPNKPLIFLVAAVVGFVIMVVLIAAREYLKD